ncbi:MAG TPA: hypothetical protein GX405_09140 [Rhizobiales bacterium]|nr:hypothetical protein [Hyphomicrobiales bacterium]
MRVFFFLVFLLGATLGIGYPYVLSNFSGSEIGVWRVYDRDGGFRTITVSLDWSDAPVRVLVDMVSVGTPRLTGDRTVLTLTASTAGRTVLAETIGFVNVTPRSDSPQSGDRIYRDEAGVIAKLDSGDYLFTVGPGDADDIEMRSVDLVLRRGAAEPDPRAIPVGYVLMAVGAIGFVIALTRGGGRPGNPNSRPPAPRWGRSARGK